VSDAHLDVCVVTPSFEQGAFIERTVRSVLDQDVDVDYLVVDGGSTDETLDVLRRYDGRLRFVSEPDRGQADAVNKGIAATRGAIVGWLNSDDVYAPGALVRVRRAFAEHPDADVVYGRADHIDADDRVIEPYPTEEWDPERLAEVCFLCQPATFLRRAAIERHGLLNVGLRYCMDYEYWLRLSRAGARFLHLPETLAGSRLHQATKTLGQRIPVHAEMNTMLRRRLGAVPDRWLSNWAHAVLGERGVTHERTPVRFAIAVSLLSWWAALRWNRRISPSLWRLTWGWIRGNVDAWRRARKTT